MLVLAFADWDEIGPLLAVAVEDQEVDVADVDGEKVGEILLADGGYAAVLLIWLRPVLAGYLIHRIGTRSRPDQPGCRNPSSPNRCLIVGRMIGSGFRLPKPVAIITAGDRPSLLCKHMPSLSATRVPLELRPTRAVTTGANGSRMKANKPRVPWLPFFDHSLDPRHKY